MLERYLIPLAPYALLALTLIAGLVIFASLEREIGRLKVRLAHQPNDRSPGAGLQKQLDDLNARLSDSERRAAAAPPALPLGRTSFNSAKRHQAIRMLRHGHPAENIATFLSMPRKQVDLLLKIDRLDAGGAF